MARSVDHLKIMNTVPVRRCFLCGSEGRTIYTGIRDRMLDAPGEWGFRQCPNRSCGLIWLDPMPMPHEIHKAYSNYYTHEETVRKRGILNRLYGFAEQGYFASQYGYTCSVRAWKKLLGVFLYCHPLRRAGSDLNIMFLEKKENGSLLEIGCGNGERMNLLRAMGWEVEGVEVDPIAAQKAAEKGLNVKLGSVDTQGYPADRFDSIIMNHLIEHVHHPSDLLRECYRILKPKGRITIVTPNSESLAHALFKFAWVHLDPPRHLYIFNSKSLASLLGEFNFRRLTLKRTVQWKTIAFTGSRCIARHNGSILNGRPTFFNRAWGRWMEMVEYGLLKSRPVFGEEIVLFADK